ncbi:MAG TPA: MFS transporter [Xylella taiwanensis]
MSTSPSSTATLRTLLYHTGFSYVLAYRIAATLSYQIVSVTIGWHIYEITHNPFLLGLVALAEILPFFCIAPFAGYLVDHLPQRRLGMIASVGLTITPAILLIATSDMVSVHSTWPIYVAASLSGMVRSFLVPVYNALFARVLRREDYARGAGLGTVVFQTSLVLSPVLAGILIAWGGKGLAYATAVVAATIALLALALLRIKEPTVDKPRAPVLRSIAEGARFVFSNQIMLGAMVLDMFSVLLGGAVSMLPAFIQDIFHYGPEGLGILRGTPALGSVLAGLWLARHPLQRHAGRALLLAVAGFGVCTIAFGLSQHFWLSAAILLAYGACDGVSVVLRSAILQLVTPDEMRGRVSAINSIFIGSSNELGAFYDGVMARFIGLVHAVILGGCMTLVVVSITALKAPRLRRLDLRDL